MRARLRNARTPNEVFFDRAIRVPRRVPDESFAYLFFDLVEGGRLVGNNGVQCENRIYRLESLESHFLYWGERVDVRLNPDDQTVAMIYDRRTGEYVCRALADLSDATYDTRDDVTRSLIARVFSDGKHLLRMAKAFVDGANERLIEYRRAKIDYLVARIQEAKQARGDVPLASDAVTVIGQHSGIVRKASGDLRDLLTVETVGAVLDADDATADKTAPLCVVSSRKPVPAAAVHRQPPYAQIARRLGTSRSALTRYRNGSSPWPPGMQEHYERIRTAEGFAADTAPDPTMKRRYRGEHSLRGIAQAIGMSLSLLELCKAGKHRWPEGKQQEFEARLRNRPSG